MKIIENLPSFSLILRRISIIFLVTLLYIFARTFIEYRSLRYAKEEQAKTTAVMVHQMADQTAFMQRLREMIRDEMERTGTKIAHHGIMTEKRQKNGGGADWWRHTQRERHCETNGRHMMASHQQEATNGGIDGEQSNNNGPVAFSFRLHMNFSRLSSLFDSFFEKAPSIPAS